MQTEEHQVPEEARSHVREFFSRCAGLTQDEVAALRREYRRTGQVNLNTDPEFLSAVCSGAWGREHTAVAREISAAARLQATALVPWPRRGVVASALEAAALAVLSASDPRHPLPETLCARLTAPYERATGAVIPSQRASTM